ncbi:MAG: hypothetical protein IPL99_04045 [Candidatus Competibacteraceae bacterium]|nr:hypothetical protein [Candidatus Competibacteraceae bacterium]
MGENRLVPDIIRAFQAGRPVTIRHPDAVRPWQHVLEPLCGYLLLAERLWTEGPAYAEGWNFGPSEEDARPVHWLAERLATLWGEGAGWRQDGDPHPHEAHYLRLDCAKAHERLGWRCAGIWNGHWWKRVAWYRAHQSGEDIRAVTLAQITDYESMAEIN